MRDKIGTFYVAEGKHRPEMEIRLKRSEFLGVAPEQATVTALLYGISIVLQGVVAAPLFLVTE